MTTGTEVYWDPFDVEIDRDPYAIWKRLRDEAPVYRNEQYDFFALARFDDVEAAHRDPGTFSSAHGTVLEIMGPDPMVRGAGIIFMDPPDHTRLRALVSRAFTPRRIGMLEERIRELCHDFLGAQARNTTFDYVQDFGARLPALVIASLLGVPLVDQDEVRKHIDLTFHIEPGVGMINDVSLNAQIWLYGYLSEQLEARRKAPRDDMLSDLVQAEIVDDTGAHRRLDDHEATSFANLLISAGTETVAKLLGWAAVTLAAHPDQRAELAADRSLVPNAVEELLRYEAPSPVQGRWVTADVDLHGVRIPQDSKILLLTGSAGRDERKYADAARFDIHRDFDHHVSFGYGIHFCIGAALARMEGRIALEETLARYPEWDVDHDGAERMFTSTVRGYAKVPIVVR
jgi:cytochrome P450